MSLPEIDIGRDAPTLCAILAALSLQEVDKVLRVPQKWLDVVNLHAEQGWLMYWELVPTEAGPELRISMRTPPQQDH